MESDTNQEYTSSAGGNIFFPVSCSFFKNFFNSRKLLLVTSFFNSFSQLSSRVPISKANKSFCSALSVLTQASLSNFIAGAGGEDVVSSALVAVSLVVLETTFGGPKNEVIEPLALGFLASDRIASVALRFRDDMMLDGQWRRRSRRDSSRSRSWFDGIL